MKKNSSNPFFEYWDEAPHEWSSLLSEKIKSGVCDLRVPILWGVHEQSPGMSDFSKQSRLRIEKLLSISQELGVRVEIILGFPFHPQCFPAWISEESLREDIPHVFWQGVPPYFAKLSVPSPRASKVKEGFLSFLDDLIPILSLYIAPEGPITKLVLDLGPLEFSQSLITAPEYVEHLESRYCSLDEFNRRFQTHFKNLSALTTQSGSKIADGKRPWLFAHDYQWCRQQIVENYLQEIVTKKIPDRIRSVLVKTAGSTKVSSSVQSKLGICFESTLIQVGNSNSLSPLMIGSQISSSAVQAFQWASSCFDLCKIRPVDFTFSHLLSPQSFGDHPCGLVITGKYMQNKQAAMLGEWVNQGKHLFFPMGVPQFDENLESFDFNAVGNRTVVKFHGIDWFKVSKSGGFFYCPVQTSVFQSVGAIEKLVDTLISQHQGEIDG